MMSSGVPAGLFGPYSAMLWTGRKPASADSVASVRKKTTALTAAWFGNAGRPTITLSSVRSTVAWPPSPTATSSLASFETFDAVVTPGSTTPASAGAGTSSSRGASVCFCRSSIAMWIPRRTVIATGITRTCRKYNRGIVALDGNSPPKNAFPSSSPTSGTDVARLYPMPVAVAANSSNGSA